MAGTTFSNIKEKDNYESVDKASVTFDELEEWLLNLIVNIYHKRIHRGIEMRPETFAKYPSSSFPPSSRKPVFGFRLLEEKKFCKGLCPWKWNGMLALVVERPSERVFQTAFRYRIGNTIII